MLGKVPHPDSIVTTAGCKICRSRIFIQACCQPPHTARVVQLCPHSFHVLQVRHVPPVDAVVAMDDSQCWIVLVKIYGRGLGIYRNRVAWQRGRWMLSLRRIVLACLSRSNLITWLTSTPNGCGLGKVMMNCNVWGEKPLPTHITIYSVVHVERKSRQSEKFSRDFL